MTGPAQTYATHRNIPWLFGGVLALAIGHLVLRVILAVRSPSLATTADLLAAALLIALPIVIRIRIGFRLQDRIIRVEQQARLHRLFPGRPEAWAGLDLAHLIALRFAPDAEVPELVARIRSGELASADAVKRAIVAWQGDRRRV